MLWIKFIMSCWLAGSVISDQQTNVKNVHDAGSSVNSGVSIGNDSGRVKASGKLVSEVRSLAPFTALAVEGALDVEVQRGAASRITISADKNAIDYVVINVSNGKLSAGLRENCILDSRIKLLIETPVLTRVDFS